MDAVQAFLHVCERNHVGRKDLIGAVWRSRELNKGRVPGKIFVCACKLDADRGI